MPLPWYQDACFGRPPIVDSGATAAIGSATMVGSRGTKGMWHTVLEMHAGPLRHQVISPRTSSMTH